MIDKDLTIIGLDPSLNKMAACFLPFGKPAEAVLYGEPRRGHLLEERMARYELLAGRVAHDVGAAMPARIFIEGYSYASHEKAKVTAEFGGILRLTLMRVCTVVEVPPPKLKLFATGKGNANKTAVITALVKRYGVEFGTDDEYDAFALAKLGACILGWEVPATEGQRRAVNSMREE